MRQMTGTLLLRNERIGLILEENKYLWVFIDVTESTRMHVHTHVHTHEYVCKCIGLSYKFFIYTLRLLDSSRMSPRLSIVPLSLIKSLGEFLVCVKSPYMCLKYPTVVIAILKTLSGV
jgi:hypothetical protein